VNSHESPPRLSILIPVYNWDVTWLVESLRSEIELAGLHEAVELKCFDDASTDHQLREINRRLFAGSGRGWEEYREASINQGRAKIRLDLAAVAKGEWLLFMDADVIPDSKKYLNIYIDEIKKGSADAVCGGTGYSQRIMTGSQFDFYLYLVARAGQSNAAMRNNVPWQMLLTSNMLVRREVFQKIPFDSRFVCYGYEDQEWGIRVKNAYRLLHIDNTVSHLGLQTKSELYRKMRESIGNYDLLRQWHPREFAETSMASVENFFSRFPISMLTRLDLLLEKVYFLLDRPYSLVFFCYQLNKAVLLAMAKNRRVTSAEL